MLDFTQYMEKLYLLITVTVLLLTGCNREVQVTQIVDINLTIAINRWAGGTGEIDRLKYEKEMERYKSNSKLIRFFLDEPEKPPEIIFVNPDELRISIHSGDKLIYESRISDHDSSRIAHVAKGFKNIISIGNGNKVLKMYEFIVNNNQTIHLNLGPGVTFTKW